MFKAIQQAGDEEQVIKTTHTLPAMRKFVEEQSESRLGQVYKVVEGPGHLPNRRDVELFVYGGACNYDGFIEPV